MDSGVPVGGTVHRVLEQIGFFTGLGVAIVLLAGMAIGRFSVIGVRETRLAERAAAARAERETAEREAAERETATRTEPVTPVTAGPVSTEPDSTEPDSTEPASTESDGTTTRLPRRRIIPGRQTDQNADTGTTTAQPDGERVDSAAP